MSPAAAFVPDNNIVHREAIQAQNPLAAVPKIPLLAIKGQLCFRCFAAPAGPLIQCPGCRRASYCSNACRRYDWDAEHGAQCHLLQVANEMQARQKVKRQKSWQEYTVDLFDDCHQLRNQADTDVTDQVTRLIGYQPYCSGCHRSAAQIPLANLRACHRCRLVFTCGTCKFEHSADQCESYQQMGKLELLRMRNFEDDGSGRTASSSSLQRDDFTPASSTWLDYFSIPTPDHAASDIISTDVSPVSSPDSATTATSPDPSITHNNSTNTMSLLGQRLSLATESLSIPLTILAALHDTLPDLHSRTSLSIHLVGASAREVSDIALFEELLHLLPTLQHLSLVLAGPEAPGEPGAGNAGSEAVEMECCATCTALGRRRTVQLFRGVYDAFGTSAAYTKPDMAVLLHSGRSQKEIESWKPTTRFLVEQGILTLCTTYTEREAMEEVKELEEWGVQLVVKPEVNRWRSLVPILGGWDGTEGEVFYVGFWRYVFGGQLGVVQGE